MNLSELSYPKDTKNRVQNLLVQEARRKPKPSPRWRKPALLTFAGLALAGSTAAGVYVALAPVDDKRDIRCYFHADLNATYPVAGGAPGTTMPPYMTTGIFITGFDARTNPNPDDKNAGMKQVADPINLCSRVWDDGGMNPNGITNDLIPAGFVPSAPVGKDLGNGLPDTDRYGNPLRPGPNTRFGQYVPPLTACVVDNTVAVIPGGPEICARLGIPTLEK